jgi:hypothetical protein
MRDKSVVTDLPALLQFHIVLAERGELVEQSRRRLPGGVARHQMPAKR